MKCATISNNILSLFLKINNALKGLPFNRVPKPLRFSDPQVPKIESVNFKANDILQSHTNDYNNK